MSLFDPIGIDGYEAGTRRGIAYSIAAVFGLTVALVFATFWWHSHESEHALAVLSAVVGVFGTVTGYYFAKGDAS